MDVQGVERIANLVRHAGGEQGQRLNALALDRLVCALPGFGRVVQDQRQAAAAGCVAIQRRGIKIQETGPRILDFELVPCHPRPARLIGPGQRGPIQLRQEPRDRLPFRRRMLQAQQTRDGLVEIDNAPRFIDDQHAVLDRVEQRLEQRALASQPLDHSLKALRVEAPKAAEDFVEKTGFGRRQWKLEIRN